MATVAKTGTSNISGVSLQASGRRYKISGSLLTENISRNENITPIFFVMLFCYDIFFSGLRVLSKAILKTRFSIRKKISYLRVPKWYKKKKDAKATAEIISGLFLDLKIETSVAFSKSPGAWRYSTFVEPLRHETPTCHFHHHQLQVGTKGNSSTQI